MAMDWFVERTQDGWIVRDAQGKLHPVLPRPRHFRQEDEALEYARSAALGNTPSRVFKITAGEPTLVFTAEKGDSSALLEGVPDLHFNPLSALEIRIDPKPPN